MNENRPSSGDASILLTVEKIVKTFPARDDAEIRALDDVSFEAAAGQVTGLIGADGAGKTTLIRCAAGLLKPTGGRICVLGLDPVVDPLQTQSRIGYMPQKFGLYQDLTVQENLTLYADLQSIPRNDRRDRYDELLTMTGLQDFQNRRAGALSGGMKQKLGLACALVKRPEMLLLDEPTVGVDPVSRRDLWKIVYQLVRDEKLGVLLSTAYLDEAEACHKIVLLHEGRKLREGPPSDFHQLVKGRVFVLEPRKDEKAREIQSDVLAEENVIDATTRKGRVRIVLKNSENAPDDPASALPEKYRDRLEPVAPSFEDAFMDAVPRSAEHRRAAARQEPARSGGANGEEVMVQADQLVKRFGDFEAVRDISFEVKGGEIFGLLGPNGAGKTTTFRMLCGLLPISSGEAHVAGRDLRRSRARARERLGYMAQTFSLYGQMSVLENFRFFGRAYGLNRKRLSERIEWALEDFGLNERKDDAAGTLPAGYKQRLAMAAALLHEPDILFLDEPTSGVDPMARREFWIRIGRFAEGGVTVVVTTHFMEEAEYCDRMLIMSKGTKLALGTPQEIRTRARTDDHPDPSIEDAFIALALGQAGNSEEKDGPS
jgi:ABC-2 type transport system ATP-binding protein